MNPRDHDTPSPAGRPPRVWPLAALVAVVGAFPLYGVIYQMWPDFRAREAPAQAQTEAASQVAAQAAPSAPAPGSGAAAGAQRRSTDFVPKQPEWSRILGPQPAAASASSAQSAQSAQSAAAGRGQTIASAGNGAGAAPCISCHAATPQPQAGMAFPSLAGLSAEYVAKQLVDYRAGTRNDPVMGPIAKALKDEDIAAVARYYASQPAAAVTLPDPASADRAGRLHAIGDNARGLPACANCHGGAGDGVGPLLPRLAGQPADYLIKQLAAFRDGTRSNDGDAVMRAAAQRLTEDDARALGAFYAGAAR